MNFFKAVIFNDETNDEIEEKYIQTEKSLFDIEGYILNLCLELDEKTKQRHNFKVDIISEEEI